MKPSLLLINLLSALIIFTNNLLAQEAPDKAAVRIYDARIQTPTSPRLAVFLNNIEVTADITPGEATFWRDLPIGDYPVNVKDAAGKLLCKSATPSLKAGMFATVLLSSKSDIINVVSVAVSREDILKAKNSHASLFIPVNLSNGVDYTFELSTRDTPPKIKSITIAPGEWEAFPIQLEKTDWRVTAKHDGKISTVALSRFPAIPLLENQSAIFIMPDPTEKSQIVALDSAGGGFITEDH